jgi:hypothetical protein
LFVEHTHHYCNWEVITGYRLIFVPFILFCVTKLDIYPHVQKKLFLDTIIHCVLSSHGLSIVSYVFVCVNRCIFIM